METDLRDEKCATELASNVSLIEDLLRRMIRKAMYGERCD